MRFLIFTTLSAMHWLIICWIGWSWILGETVEAHKMIALAFLSGAHIQVTSAMMRWYDNTHTATQERQP